MKTTTAFIICCLCSLSLALETVYVGDFIHPPTAFSNPGFISTHQMLLDTLQQPNYLGNSMSNGKGIQTKYAIDEIQKTITGTLLIKNDDGTYRSKDLPFNCTSFGSATVNGEVFICGNKIFNLGPGDEIQNAQNLITSSNSVVFSNSSVFTETFGSVLKSWSNIPENPTWDQAESSDCLPNPVTKHQIYPNHAITVVLTGTATKLFKRNDLTWNLLETLDLNFTGEANINPHVLWDGADTIISGWRAEEVGVNTLKGRIKIFRKVSGSWSLSKVITSTDLGLAAPGGLGVRLLLIDENTVLVHAVDGYNRTRALTGGSSFALEKINNDWVVTTKFVQQNNNDAYLLGAMSYDKSDGRLYFTACRTVFDGRFSGRECGIKYAVWNRA